jgi:hypothetical protein
MAELRLSTSARFAHPARAGSVYGPPVLAAALATAQASPDPLTLVREVGCLVIGFGVGRVYCHVRDERRQR